MLHQQSALILESDLSLRVNFSQYLDLNLYLSFSIGGVRKSVYMTHQFNYLAYKPADAHFGKKMKIKVTQKTHGTAFC